ncbi:MAG: glycosyltransferase [Anaerolineaceae bacterium]
MHILLVADGRSPITRRWIQTLKAMEHQITLISTYPCEPPEGVEAMLVMPVAFSSASGSQAGKSKTSKKGLISRFRPLFSALRYRLGPLTLPRYGRNFSRLVKELSPDLVHALRIPYEGMLARYTPQGTPLIISTWGNDLTLHAPATARMTELTRKTLQRANGLMADCQRDIRLAQAWGFDAAKPSLAVAGNGGLDLDETDVLTEEIRKLEPLQIINPRGMRSYVRNDTFFRAAALVRETHPEVRFVCASMAGQSEAEAWVENLNLQDTVKLLPYLDQAALWQEFARSSISVSITTHDGTPNTLLEAMAFSCLPVCGDIESIREWITPGVNGLLADPNDPYAAAESINLAIENSELRRKAAEINRSLLKDRAEVHRVRAQITRFYETFQKPQRF